MTPRAGIRWGMANTCGQESTDRGYPLPRHWLLPHAKRREDDPQQIIHGRRAGNRVERVEGVVEVEEEHFVRDALDGGLARAGQGPEAIFDQLLVAKVGNEFAFGAGVAGGRGEIEDPGS